MNNTIVIFTGLLCFCLLEPSPAAQAQENTTPPELNQPTNFSQLVGVFAIKTSAAPTEAFVEERIELTVVIKGSGPNKKYLPAREHLRIFPTSMQRDFYIGESPKKDKYDPKKEEWTFCYHLLPKHDKVSKIPSVQLTFYNPNPKLPPEYRFQSSYSRAIPLTIKVPPDVMAAPSRMYDLVRGESVLAREETSTLSGQTILLVLILSPLAALAGFCLWQYTHPDYATQIQRRQSRAAQFALKQLRRMGRQDPAAQVGDVVRAYLQQRFHLASIEPTPREIMEHLYSLGLSLQVTEQAMRFFAEVHEMRFCPEHRNYELVAHAVTLVHGLEAETR